MECVKWHTTNLGALPTGTGFALEEGPSTGTGLTGGVGD